MDSALVLVTGVNLALSISSAEACLDYVSNEKDNTISVIDNESLEVVQAIDVGERSRGIVLSGDASTLHVCTSDEIILKHWI